MLKMTIKNTQPAAITIFGAKGDLTHRKLIPALFNLFLGNHLHQTFAIFCVDFITADETEFKNELLAGVNEFSRTGKAVDTVWQAFAGNIHYISGDFLKAETYLSLKDKLAEFDIINKINSGVVAFFIMPWRHVLLKPYLTGCTSIRFATRSG